MKYVLFDLDGTISDSSEGILKTFHYAMDALGLPAKTDAELLPFIGPPLLDTFRDSLGLTQTEAERGLTIFRERYAVKGKYENELYAGITEVLYTLTQEGVLLGVATSKPEKYAIDILEHFGIALFFPVIVGASLDDTFSAKKDIMEKAIACGKARNPEISEIYMVGDRFYDMEASRELGVTAIGVTYGFGSEEELRKTGANFICHTPNEILSVVLGK